MDTPRTPPPEPPETAVDNDRDPRTGAPDVGVAPFPGGGQDQTEGADEGGVKTADGGPPSPDSPTTPGGVEGAGLPERLADPAISIDAINGEGEARPDRSDHTGGMIGEGAV